MKVSFSKEQKFIPEWKGNQDLPPEEQISCVLGILDMAALMDLLDAFSESGLQETVDTDKIEGGKIKAILQQFGDLLPKHVTELKGLFNESGEAITIENIVTYPIFLNLALELLMKLSMISSPSEDDAKKLNKPSD